MKHLITLSAIAALVCMPSSSVTWSQTTATATTVWTVGWTSRPALSQHVLDSGQESIFLPRFIGTWGYGGVVAKRLDAQGNILDTSPWPDPRASIAIEKQDPQLGRRIFTRLPTGEGTPFTWDTLAPSQQAALGDGVLGPRVLRYLRGDRSLEAPSGPFRPRAELLGAVVHSSLVHWRHRDGRQRLYFGASDGMLHALDATNGQERFAYVPSMLMPKMASLTQASQAAAPRVDGPLAMTEVLEPGGSRTLLVGGLGAGGAGLFALDVGLAEATAPSEAAKSVLWEITPLTPGFANLGETHAMPQFTRLQNTERTPAVVVGNGYFNAGNQQASLFVVHAITGALIAEWPTLSGSANTPNGLSTPTLVDSTGDGTADWAYAGDLLGQLWRFDLRTLPLGSTRPTLLFTDPDGMAITTAPVVTPHPQGGQMVVFGTGRTLTPADLDDRRAHSVYGLWDGAPATHTTGLDQTITELAPTTESDRWRHLSAHQPNWDTFTVSMPKHMGWRLSLPPGERLVGSGPLLTDGLITFSSINPSQKSDPGAAPGVNWVNQVQALTGAAPPRPVWDTNADGSVNASDNIEGHVISSQWVGNGVVSQPVLADAGRLGRTYLNQNPELSITANTPTASTPTEGGISGGHFDVDLHYKAGKSYGSQKHQHEYDDRYNVVGINFNNPSDSAFNLGKAIAAGTPFKVLVLNAYLNPASYLSVANGPFVSVKEFQGQASAADTQFIDSLPTFTRAGVEPLVWRLPPDAFSAKDWWQDGGAIRAGLMPTETGCVKSGPSVKPGPLGSIYNGALTLQLIRHDTPASALEPNAQDAKSQQDPRYGWRVKAADRDKWVLAEYTMFWHHAGNGCFGSRNWRPDPALDTTSQSKPGSTPQGSGDPTGSVGTGMPGSVRNLVGVRLTSTDGLLTLLFADGSTALVPITDKSIQLRYRDASTITHPDNISRFLGADASTIPTGARRAIGVSGRYNWRELTFTWTEPSPAASAASR